MVKVKRLVVAWAWACVLAAAGCAGTEGTAGSPTASAPAAWPAAEWVAVAPDGRGFCLQPSGRAFMLWGFNYDHDEAGRLLEDYWADEWPKVEQDFHEMRQLGANVVRVHLQLG